MNDYWLVIQAQERARDIRREMMDIRRAQSIGMRQRAFHFNKWFGIRKQHPQLSERGGIYDSAGHVILAVD